MTSRVCLARAFMMNPQVLLMDEPFSALDSLTKEKLHLELQQLAGDHQATVVFITHDLQEAVYLSDRVIVLGGQPSRMTADIAIPWRRPRRPDFKFDNSFQQLLKQVYEAVEKDGSH
jgi:NitT/TauT family transport system ATP-binding protein